MNQFKQPLPHFPLTCKYFSNDFLAANRITWKTIFFFKARKKLNKNTKISTTWQNHWKARQKSEMERVPIPTTLLYTVFLRCLKCSRDFFFVDCIIRYSFTIESGSLCHPVCLKTFELFKKNWKFKNLNSPLNSR
jgi:hypothetical protein